MKTLKSLMCNSLRSDVRFLFGVLLVMTLALPPHALGQTMPDAGRMQQENNPIPSHAPADTAVLEAPVRRHSASDEPAQPEELHFDIAGFIIEGNTILPESKIQKLLAPYKGAARGMADLDNAALALHQLYENAGYPVVQVTPPAQTIVEGKVVLQVVEDRINLITVSGNTAYSTDNIKASLPPLKPGKSLNVNRLQSAITLANENSGKQISVSIMPGEKLGNIDAHVDVVEDKVSKIMATVDNTGSPSTGSNKINLAYQHANVFDRDHALTMQIGTSPSYLSDMYNLSLGYHVPFYQKGISVDLSTAYSNSSTTQSGGLFFAGKGYVSGVHVNWPLANWADIHQKIIVGTDYKTNNNTCSGSSSCGTITEIPASAMYYLQVVRPAFQGNGSLTYVSSLHGGSHADTASYTAARSYGTTPGIKQAGPIWDLWRLNGTANLMLPNDWQSRLTWNGQFTNDLLIPAEKFGIGGATSVRGYPERVQDGDNGYTVNMELYTPDIKQFQTGGYLTNFRALAFLDAGRASQNVNLSASLAPGYELYSYGLGLRMSGIKNTSLKLDLGIAQKAVPFGATTIKKGDVRSCFSFSFVF